MSKKNKTKITASPTKENTTAKIKKSVTDKEMFSNLCNLQK
ncbi:hypothetical protein [Spiroplasma endosymbiont of Panzeria rudis]